MPYLRFAFPQQQETKMLKRYYIYWTWIAAVTEAIPSP